MRGSEDSTYFSLVLRLADEEGVVLLAEKTAVLESAPDLIFWPVVVVLAISVFGVVSKFLDLLFLWNLTN